MPKRLQNNKANGAKPKGRPRHYTPAEKLGYMMLALQTDTVQVEREHGIPGRTIRSWFEEAGGIATCRHWLEAEMVSIYLRSRQAIFEAVIVKAKTLGEEQLMETYRKLAAPSETPQGGKVGAVAMAKSEVHVHLDDSGS